MGQSAWKIAEAKSAAQEKPRENSLQSETAVDALLGQSGETTTSSSFPTGGWGRRRQDFISCTVANCISEASFYGPRRRGFQYRPASAEGKSPKK